MKKKIIEYFKKIFIISNYISHNKKCFNLNNKKENIVLLEYNPNCSSIISYSYLANILSEKYNAEIISYRLESKTSLFSKIFWFINSNFLPSKQKIFKSFGVKKFININISNTFEIKKLYQSIIEPLKTKNDILEIKINSILVGDLIYDSFLRKYNKSTIDINDNKFREFLIYFIKTFIFWESYFENQSVKSLIVSHCVYMNAVPLRIAVERNIDAYQINSENCHRLNKEQYFAYKEHLNYPEIFSKFDDKIKKNAIENSKKRLERRFSGEAGVDMRYSKISAYGKFLNQRLISESPRKKILLAAHCFSDSPHSYGRFLFPDFYEWIDFLGKLSEKTDYDWYIKTHPDYIQSSRAQVEFFVNKYQKFKLLPVMSSHLQIIKEGIDFVLTVHGTIALEYAALGKVVINASQVNPHAAYNFNINPKSLNEYKNILENLGNIKHAINKDSIYEYYYMRNIFKSADWLFESYNLMINQLGGYKNQYKPEVFNYWLKNWTKKRHMKINQILKFFVDSGDYNLDLVHIKSNETHF